MIRRIIKIDEEKCIGCGICAQACHEGAIEMIGGKVSLPEKIIVMGWVTAFLHVR